MQLPLNQVRPGFPVEIALPSPGGTLNRKDAKSQVKRPTPVFENKKQVRQHFLYDTLRKVVRKRENAAKQNRKFSIYAFRVTAIYICIYLRRASEEDHSSST